MELGERDLERLNWFGAKRALASILGAPGLNPVVQFVGRKLLPIRLARRLPLRRRSATYRLLESQVVHLLDPLHDIVARDIHWGRAKPTSGPEQLKLQCIELLSKDAALFLDIGAYNGVCALIAARSNPKLRAVAFEVVPENYELLVRNIAENKLEDRVEPRLCGIGANADCIRVPVHLRLSSHPTSISLGSVFKEGACVTVPVMTIDELFGEYTGPAFIKIDVEGYEAQVFSGARHFISKNRPDIICEVLPDASRACQLIEEFLEPHGYRWWMFDEEMLVGKPCLAPTNIPRDWIFSVRGAVPGFGPHSL